MSKKNNSQYVSPAKKCLCNWIQYPHIINHHNEVESKWSFEEALKFQTELVAPTQSNSKQDVVMLENPTYEAELYKYKRLLREYHEFQASDHPAHVIMYPPIKPKPYETWDKSALPPKSKPKITTSNIHPTRYGLSDERIQYELYLYKISLSEEFPNMDRPLFMKEPKNMYNTKPPLEIKPTTPTPTPIPASSQPADNSVYFYELDGTKTLMGSYDVKGLYVPVK